MTRLTKIDGLLFQDHYYLEPTDNCYFFGEYTAGENHAYSATNQLIFNFKKSISTRNTAQWTYKERAIVQAAQMFRAAVRAEDLANVTFVPVPPSKVRTDPLYDDRIVRSLMAAFGPRADIRELVTQRQSMQAVHLVTGRRPSPAELTENYTIDENLAQRTPQLICIVDDVVTTGTHYKAMSQILTQRFPQSQIVGLFLARRVPKSVDFDEL